MPKVKWENRNKFQITEGQMGYRQKMAAAALNLCRAIVEVEKKYDLTILDVLQLLNKEQQNFLNAGLEYEAKERWEEEQNAAEKEQAGK